MSPTRSPNTGRPDDAGPATPLSGGSKSDSGLTRRIGATLALVLVADALFVTVLVFLFRPWLVTLVGESDGLIGTGAWVALVAGATGALAWGQLQYTRREVLAEADARAISASEYPDLHARLRRLAQATDVTPPDLALAETDAANCFTVGDLRGGTIVVSTGLLEALSGEELDAVLAHELAHLRNRDAAVMTVATFLPALANDDYSLFGDISGPPRTLALGVAAIVGYAVSTALVAAPPFSLASFLAFGAFAAFTVLFGGVALGLLALPVAVLTGRLSRYREFAADRAGALLVGNPAAMAGALETLDAEASTRPTEDVRSSAESSGIRASPIRELCFLPHGITGASDGDGGVGDSDDGSTGNDGTSDGDGTQSDDPLAGLPVEVATHPPTEERIARLRGLAAEGRDGYQ